MYVPKIIWFNEIEVYVSLNAIHKSQKRSVIKVVMEGYTSEFWMNFVNIKQVEQQLKEKMKNYRKRKKWGFSKWKKTKR